MQDQKLTSSPKNGGALSVRFYLAVMAFVLLTGIAATIWVSHAEDAHMRAGLLTLANMAAASVHIEELTALGGAESDLQLPAYQVLKSHLSLLRAAHPLCRFIYLTGIHEDGTVFFFVDSEPPDSEDYSPPGQVYTEASDAFRAVFSTGQPLLEGPVPDVWGNWVSALVPISKANPAIPNAVLGIDVDARDWTRNILIRTAPVVTLTLLLLALPTFFLLLQRRADQARQRIAISEARLAQSESAYRGIVMSMLDIFYRVDANGTVTMTSPSAAGILGYDSIDELLGIKVETIWAQPQQRAALMDELRCKGETRDYELATRRKDGSELQMSVSVRMLYDSAGNPDGYEGIARDITDRKRAEKELKCSEEKYRNMIESIEEGYFELDLRSKLSFFNNALCRMTGRSKEELALVDFTDLVPAEALVRISQSMRNSANSSSAVRINDLEIRRKDGTVLCVDLSASPIVAADGAIAGCRGLLRDISERKQSERQQQELESQIQRAQKMEAIGTLAGGVAHDLNNILSGIVSYPDLVLMRLPPKSPLRGPLESIKSSGVKASAIVQDLLTLARRGVTVAEVVRLNDLITAYFNSPEFLKMKSFHPRVSIHTDLDARLVNIIGSPVHLSKTIMNLVSNAAEAMPNGGPITITTRTGYVDFPIKGYDHVREGDYTVLSVADGGTGISPEDRARIFEPFFTKKKMGRSGTGLGLAVVWGTVKDHKGYIDIQSVEGQGTTFTLYFPVTRKAPALKKRTLTREEIHGHGEKILVIDDVAQQREIATAILTQLGYAVATLASGEEAVPYLQTHPADMVVLDMIMDPRIDGLETYERIWSHNPRQRVILTSGYSVTERVKKALRLGARRYLKKPYTLETLGIAVKEELPAAPPAEQ
jgi:PAS domain S-box-containing protein